MNSNTPSPSAARVSRKLDDARLGLLVRLSYHRACIASRRILDPLIKRGLIAPSDSRGKTHEITKLGRDLVERFLADNKRAHLVTWPGISIGQEVMIVKDEPLKQEKQK